MIHTMAFLWSCDQGCPPVHMNVEVTEHADGTLSTTDRGSRLLARGVHVHLKVLHDH